MKKRMKMVEVVAAVEPVEVEAPMVGSLIGSFGPGQDKEAEAVMDKEAEDKAA